MRRCNYCRFSVTCDKQVRHVGKISGTDIYFELFCALILKEWAEGKAVDFSLRFIKSGGLLKIFKKETASDKFRKITTYVAPDEKIRISII